MQREKKLSKINRRTFSAGVVSTGALAGGIASPSILRAQGYPAGQQIKFIVGFPAGGAQDIVGRVVADRLGALWGVPTVVENVAGAGANIAMDRVAKGPTDGTQIMIVPPGFATNQFLYARMPFDPEKDIIPLGYVASIPNLLCVKKDLPVDSVAELIAYAKANPGKLNYASTSVGTTTHLSGALFVKMTGTDIVVVHYRGSAPAMNDLLSGNVDMIFDNIAAIVPQARAGTVKALGITTAKRSPHAPEYPPIGDTVKGYDTTSWIGVGVRAGTSKEICDKIEAGVKVICQDKLLKDRLATLVSEAVGGGAAEFAQFVADERKKWGALVAEQKIKLE
jgi:tripartite-type tricarboxylate transporter receptor subunit TctC